MKKRLQNFIFAAALSAMAGSGAIVKAQTISAGQYHSLFLCSDGSAMGCGSNLACLGDGTYTQRNTPVQCGSLTGLTAISGGSNHSLFLKNNGTVWACGYNSAGELGDGSTTPHASPVQIISLSGITAIAGGFTHSLFLKNDGTVWACGANNYGSLGDGTTTNSSTPVQVNGLTGIIAIAAGQSHSIFLKNDGTVWTCGYNNLGQLGNGTTVQSNVPVQVIGVSNIIAVAGGYSHSLFLKSDGSVWACGYNGYGELGVSSSITLEADLSIQASTPGNIVAMAAGKYHSVFLKSDGTAWVCGSNAFGQIGNGATGAEVSPPVQVSTLSGIIGIAGGEEHSLFLKSDGTAWSCGYNVFGGLGDGTTAQKTTPVQVTGLCSVASSVKENSSENNFIVYPNPNNGAFTIEFSENTKNATAQIISIAGEILYNKTILKGNNAMSAEDLAPGIYFVRVMNGNKISTSKFIKQ